MVLVVGLGSHVASSRDYRSSSGGGGACSCGDVYL